MNPPLPCWARKTSMSVEVAPLHLRFVVFIPFTSRPLASSWSCPPPPPLTSPFTPMEKSMHSLGGAHWGWVSTKKTPKKLLSQNALSLSPQGVPMQFAPAVVELKDRPVRSPIGHTLR